jgi:hypothetical protein
MSEQRIVGYSPHIQIQSRSTFEHTDEDDAEELLAVAHGGQMDCFAVLVAYSTGKSINAVLSALSSKDWKHPSSARASAIAVNFLGLG